MEPEKIMNNISQEILAALKAMKKAKTVEEKLTHSEIVKNLCQSLGVFLNFMSDMDMYGGDGLYEEDDDDGDDEYAPIPF